MSAFITGNHQIQGIMGEENVDDDLIDKKGLIVFHRSNLDWNTHNNTSSNQNNYSYCTKNTLLEMMLIKVTFFMGKALEIYSLQVLIN